MLAFRTVTYCTENEETPAWAGFHLAVGLPLNAWLPKVELPATTASASGAIALEPKPAEPRLATAMLLAWVFAVTWFVSTAIAAHLSGLLAALGTAPGLIVAIGMLVGPAQVAGRLMEFGFLRRLHPLLTARAAALMHPLGAALLALMGAPWPRRSRCCMARATASSLLPRARCRWPSSDRRAMANARAS